MRSLSHSSDGCPDEAADEARRAFRRGRRRRPSAEEVRPPRRRPSSNVEDLAGLVLSFIQLWFYGALVSIIVLILLCACMVVQQWWASGPAHFLR